MSDAFGVAARLCRGYNEWVMAHGPDTDGAKADQGELTIVQDGMVYEVTIKLSSVWLGNTYEMRRTCGKLNCTDHSHLKVTDQAR